MVKRLITKAKKLFFANPEILFKEERHLVNQPFFFPSADETGNSASGKAVLLIHGWSSTPYEVRRLGRYLSDNGYTASGIRLSGHGTVPKDLENVKWRQWIDDAGKELKRLKRDHEKVYVIGTSIGSNIAMMLAKENPQISGIVLMAPPYKVRLERLVVFIAKLVLFFGSDYKKKFYPPTFGASTTITRLISYQTYPVKSALETFELIRESRKDLEKITQPCLIIQSTHDHVVSGKSMEKIYGSISSKAKKKQYIEKAYHTFISDINNEHVFEDILNFLEEN